MDIEEIIKIVKNSSDYDLYRLIRVMSYELQYRLEDANKYIRELKGE